MTRIMVTVLSLAVCITASAQSTKYSIGSPSKKISLQVAAGSNGTVSYEVSLNKKTLVQPSLIGFSTDKSSFEQNLTITGSTKKMNLTEAYTLAGKKSAVKSRYNTLDITLTNKKGEKASVTFRVSDDGVAFRYHIPGKGTAKMMTEKSYISFPEATKTFLSPLQKAKTGWMETNPSYEEHYNLEGNLTDSSNYRQGWVYPALFKAANGWALVSESNVDSTYVLTHLSDYVKGKGYMFAFPHADHNRAQDPVEPTFTLPYTTPWRIIIVGEQLSGIFESTLAQDVAPQRYPIGKEVCIAGKATWSWILDDDESINYKTSKEYIDFAAAAKLSLCLIDNYWDTQIGRSKVEELVSYAKSKNVGIILWYNSNGNWNRAPQTPQNCMNTKEAREAEMQWLHKIGVKGIKVDFFGGDKQVSTKLYQEIIEAANRYGLSCNFHGATMPRGWDRMYPNLSTTEAVIGMEFCKFVQENENMRPQHLCALAFTRNVVAPMDFTPLSLNARLSRKPNQGNNRVTTAAFELALPVIIRSTSQHFALVPENLKQFPQYVWDYLAAVPTTWDETKLLEGYPGKLVVMACRKGSKWYVAGINGENTTKTLTVNFNFLKNSCKAKIIRSTGADSNDTQQTAISVGKETKLPVTLKGNDGFVMEISI